MRLFTLDRAVEITSNMFDYYVEDVGRKFMSGEVSSILFTINRRGTKEKDWLANIRVKNTSAISVFRCTVYIDDVFRLCRRCQLWLITEEVYTMAVLYAMLHPLYQEQNASTRMDYESLMAGAGELTYDFVRNKFRIRNHVQWVVLDILRCHMMIFTNKHEGISNVQEMSKKLHKMYEKLMLQQHPGAYLAARRRKAQTSMVDSEGYIILERRTEYNQGGD